MYYELTDAFEVAADIDKTWSFFSTAENLPKITPAWLNFTVTTPGLITIENDTVLDYTIHWMGIPFHWRTRIIDFFPKRQFIDLQIKGPYALWHHQHAFEPSAAGVICRDRVIYKLPGCGVQRIAHALLVRKQLLAIFAHRRKVIAEHLGWVRALQADVIIETLR